MVLAFRLVLLSDESLVAVILWDIFLFHHPLFRGPLEYRTTKLYAAYLACFPWALAGSNRVPTMADTVVARSSPLSPPVLPGRRWGLSGVGASCRVAVAQRTGQRVRTVETATIQVHLRLHETDRMTGRGQKVDGTFRPSLAWLKTASAS